MKDTYTIFIVSANVVLLQKTQYLLCSGKEEWQEFTLHDWENGGDNEQITPSR